MKALYVLLVVITLMPVRQVFAGSNAETQPEQDVITNETVIELVKLGLSDDLVIAKIRQSTRQFDTSLEGLKSLKTSGVSEAVLKEMLAPTSAPAAQVSDAVATDSPSNPDIPAELEEPGIYLYEDGAYIKVEPTTFTQTKSGGWLKSQFTSGIAKTHSKAVLPGVHAKLKTEQRTPVFYFCFGDWGTAAALSSPIMGATSPNEFVLVKMKQEKDRREIIVGEFRAITGSSSTGIKEEDVVGFDLEKLSSTVYKVTVLEPLEAGEYCFYYNNATALATQTGGGKLFDFSVHE